MAEAAGLALGVPGAIDVLIKTCLEGYQFISTARSADEDFENHRYQFKVEQQKLKDLTTTIAFRIQELTLKTDDVRFLLISSTLIRITSSDKSAETRKPSKPSRIRNIFGSQASQKDSKSESEAFETVLTLTDLQLDENLQMSTLKTLEPRLKSVINTYSRFKWACLDSEKTKTLITKLQQYNSNMEKLVDGHNESTPLYGSFPRNEEFIGESHVASWFNAYEKNRIKVGKSQHSTGHLRLALCGLGGIGKTQDVLNFIYEYENQRPVFWIHAGSVTQFEADYRKLASLAKIPGHDDTKQNIEFIKQWLEGPQSGEWILVIDNADNKLDFYPETSTESKEKDTVSIEYDGMAAFIPRGSKGTIIVTTRDREVALNLANQNVIIKPEMGPEQAIELFYQYYSNAERKSEDTAALQQILIELQYLPLAIVQVAAYLHLNRSITTSRYLEIFQGTKESQKRLLSKPHRNIWRDKNKNAETILTTFSISFHQIQQQSKLANLFLQFLACIDRKAIPHDLLFKFQIKMDGVEDELLISEALDKLVNFSILQNSKIDFGSGQAYEIHSLVHLAMQTYLESGEKNNTLAKTSTVLADILPHSEYENWGTWRVYLPHVTALLAHLMVEDSDSEASADLCMKAGWYLIELGRYSESLILYERARKLYAFLFGEENTKTLYSMDSIGTSFIYCGRLKEVQEILEKVLEVRRRTVGEEHPNTVTSMQNLAITYTEPGGSMKKVQELEEKVLEVRRCTLGEDHPDTLITMQNLAETYKDLGGRLNEVQQIQEEVLEVRKRILGEDHQDTANAMYNLAVTLHNLGRLDEAIVLMEEEARSYSRTYGSDHSETKDAERVAKRWKDEIKQDDGGAD